MSTLVLAGKVLGTTAIAAGALFTGVSATSGSASTSAAPTSKGADGDHPPFRCGPFGGKNDELRGRLGDIRDLPKGDERRKALRDLRKDVRGGDYGDKAQAWSFRREAMFLRFRAQAPDALKDDMKAAREKPAGDERRAAIRAVLEDAADGKYGKEVQDRAEFAVERFEACSDKNDDAEK